jgi:hypothetical protein
MKKIIYIAIGVLIIGSGVFWYVTRTTKTTGVQTFTSKELGIQFQYAAQQADGAATHVQRIGDKVYLSVGNTAITAGQFVQVFSKGATETFADAIRRHILAKYPWSGCTITVTPSNIQGGYQTAEIGYPAPTDPAAPFWDNASKCNEAYAKTNGLRHFLYDPKHPTVFAYLDIGQYGILAHDTVSWQNTLTFLP